MVLETNITPQKQKTPNHTYALRTNSPTPNAIHLKLPLPTTKQQTTFQTPLTKIPPLPPSNRQIQTDFKLYFQLRERLKAYHTKEMKELRAEHAFTLFNLQNQHDKILDNQKNIISRNCGRSEQHNIHPQRTHHGTYRGQKAGSSKSTG